MGGLAGALTAYGASKAYQGGVVPPAAYVNGAVIGAIGGFAGKLFETYQKTQNRKFIGAELQRTINNPTDRNAFGVLVANGVKGDEEFKNKILEKIQGRIEGKLETQMDDATGGFTERYNEHVLKKPKFV
jgi:hypothetical protein